MKRCDTIQAQPALTPEARAEWEELSGQLDAALELLEEFPVPYPPDCLPAIIF